MFSARRSFQTALRIQRVPCFTDTTQCEEQLPLLTLSAVRREGGTKKNPEQGKIIDLSDGAVQIGFWHLKRRAQCITYSKRPPENRLSRVIWVGIVTAEAYHVDL